MRGLSLFVPELDRLFVAARAGLRSNAAIEFIDRCSGRDDRSQAVALGRYLLGRCLFVARPMPDLPRQLSAAEEPVACVRFPPREVVFHRPRWLDRCCQLLFKELAMPFDPKVAIGTFALALLVGGGPALAQSPTTPTPSGPAAGPPTTASEKAANPPNTSPAAAPQTPPRTVVQGTLLPAACSPGLRPPRIRRTRWGAGGSLSPDPPSKLP